MAEGPRLDRPERLRLAEWPVRWCLPSPPPRVSPPLGFIRV
jgi:hypothetical protein